MSKGMIVHHVLGWTMLAVAAGAILAGVWHMGGLEALATLAAFVFVLFLIIVGMELVTK